MSRRNDLITQLIASDKFGAEKEQEQKFLLATAELILSDLVDIAISGVEKQGAGSLVINLMNELILSLRQTHISLIGLKL